MASYSTRVVSVERHEFLVPIDASWGACWAEVMKAIRAAHSELWRLGLVEQGKDASDDTIRMTNDDEHIVVFFTVERTGDKVRLT